MPTLRVAHARGRLVPYLDALAWQRRVQEATWTCAPRTDGSHHRGILLQHEPTITHGVRATPPDVAASQASLPAPPPGTVTLRVDRGGLATYHGPGQLVGYLVLDLNRAPMRRDLHWLVRSVESVVVQALSDGFGIRDAVPGPTGRSGVWVGDAKICAVGLNAKRWVTMHGFGLNVEEPCLAGFDAIVPCGISKRDASVTCVSRVLGRPVTVDEVRPHVVRALANVFGVKILECDVPDGDVTRDEVEAPSGPQAAKDESRGARVLARRLSW